MEVEYQGENRAREKEPADARVARQAQHSEDQRSFAPLVPLMVSYSQCPPRGTLYRTGFLCSPPS